MANGINFIPSSGKKKRSHRKKDRDIEYSSGQPVGMKVEGSAPEPMHSQKKIIQKEKKSPFSLWLDKKKRKSVQKKSSVVSVPSVEMHEGKNVSESSSLNILQGDIYQNEVADQSARREQLERLAKLQQKKESPTVVEPAPAPPVKIHEADLTASNESPDLFNGRPWAADHPMVSPGTEHMLPTEETVKKDSSVKNTHFQEPLITSKKKKKQRKKRKKKETVSSKKHSVVTSSDVHRSEVSFDAYDNHLNVNLIPNALLQELKQRNRLQDLVLISFGGIAVIFLLFGVMKYYQRQLTVDIQDTENRIADIQEQIDSFAEIQAEANAVNEDLKAIQDVLDQHVYWTPFLEFIEAHTLPTVYYKTMAGSAQTGSFTFDVIALDYAQIDAQVRLFENSPMIESISVTSASEFIGATVTDDNESVVTEEEQQSMKFVTFTMTVTFADELFRYPRSE